MRAKRFIVLPALALMLGACTPGAAVRTAPAPSDTTAVSSLVSDLLLLGTEHGPIAVSPSTGNVISEGSNAVAGPTGSRLYSASIEGGYTTLVTTDAATGSVVSSTRIRGELAVRAVSESGKAVAMMQPLPKGVDVWTPVPRSHTTIVVADPTGSRAPHRYQLRGNFEPEAFSVEDSRLFLIQYLPAEAPAVYRVTVLDLTDGQVYNVHGRFKTPPERMPGIRLRQVLDPNVAQLYTLYTTKPRAYAQEYGGWNTSAPVTFVHVLNLKLGWAYCAGLPKKFWGQAAGAQAIATSPDGRLLYIVDSIRGDVAVMDTHSLNVLRTEQVLLGSLGGVRTSAQVSADGKTLFVGSVRDGSAVYAIDTTTFDIVHRWTMPAVVSGLGLSADGLRLYVALDDGVAVLDAATGEQLATVPLLGVESILRVGTLSA